MSRRLATISCLSALLLGHPRPLPATCHDDPSKLQRDFKEKLLSAKTVRIKFKILIKRELDFQYEGLLLTVKDANKVLYRITDPKGKWPERKLVSNGRQVKSKGFEGGGGWHAEKMRDSLDREVLSGFARLGWDCALNGPAVARLGWDDARKISLTDFRDAGMEKIGDRTTQTIDFKYRYTEINKNWPIARWWFDTATRQPVKLTYKTGGELPEAVTEVYESIEWDPPLPDKEFELPD